MTRLRVARKGSIGKMSRLEAYRSWAADREPGQIILLLALALVGLLVAVGLALDGGVLLVRKLQLDKAVDSAALAGVTEVNLGLDYANTRGRQIMAANNVITTSAAPCASVDWTVNDYCGERQPGAIPAAIRYHVEARLNAEVYFMQLLGFQTVPLRSSATAEYLNQVDIYASDVGELGLVKISNQSIFGPGQIINFGDPYTPPQGQAWFGELNGTYTYRIRVPANYPYDQVRVEIWDPDTGNRSGNTWATYGVNGTRTPSVTCSDTNQANVCLLATPWGAPGTNPNPFWYVRIDENRVYNGNPGSYGGNLVNNTRTVYRLFYLEQMADGSLSEVDLAYYIGKADSSDAAYASPTGEYTAAEAQTEARATDMMWVSPGVPADERMPSFDAGGQDTGEPPGDRLELFAELLSIADLYGVPAGQRPAQPSPDYSSPAEPVTIVEDCDTYISLDHAGSEHIGPTQHIYTVADRCEGDGDFIIDLDTEVPGIFVDPGSGARYIYLQVRGISGMSENGFEFWAGPPRSADIDDFMFTVPSDINARQIYLLAMRSMDLEIHRSTGVSIFGLGHLPMNSNTGTTMVDIPLAYFGPEFAGQQLQIDMFDPDAGAQDPIVFYFDSIPIADWAVCYDDNGNNAWNGYRCNTLPAQYGGPLTRTGTANIPVGSVWQTPPYIFTIPSDPVQPFYGGRLIARYKSGANDTYGWRIQIESRPYLVQ